MEALFRLRSIEPTIKDSSTAKPLLLNSSEGGGRITFENVYFRYDKTDPKKSDQESNDKYILEGLNLDIPAGSTVAIVGTSGSGKVFYNIIKMILAY